MICIWRTHIFVDGYCSTVQGLLDWFEVDLGFTELSFIQIDLCVQCVFVLYSRVSLSSSPFLDILVWYVSGAHIQKWCVWHDLRVWYMWCDSCIHTPSTCCCCASDSAGSVTCLRVAVHYIRVAVYIHVDTGSCIYLCGHSRMLHKSSSCIHRCGRVAVYISCNRCILHVVIAI